MFFGCAALTLDCSDWDVPGIKPGRPNESPTPSETSWHYCFNYNAPGVILPKPWQVGAFAIYSTDDDSLAFYKRSNCELPSTGSTFNDKTITSVYTGFEKDAYTGTWPNDNCPWFNIATKVKSVIVVDAIKPKSMAWWFNNFAACTSFDLGNVDTRECVSLRRLFSGCSSCISITGLDTWDTSNVADPSATFDYLIRLKTIPGISGWNTGNVKYFARTFYNLDGLERLDLSNWDDSSLIPGTLVDGIGYSEDIFNSKYGTVKSLKSFTVGAKWNNTGYLAKRIELASSSMIPTDGKWYAASDGASYESAAAPGNKADTYYASTQLAIASKNASSWTLDEQETVANDIAANGKASVVYAKAKAAMDAGTKFTMKLTDGDTLEYRIIGINHDDLADGSGKAGLTFLTTSTGITSRMNATKTNAGGWKKSELRAKMNAGEIWNLMPSDFQSKVKLVRKLTNNGNGTDKNASVTATTDKLFLLNCSEIIFTSHLASDYSKKLNPDILDPEPEPDYPWNPSDYPWISSEGTQYEAFRGKVTEIFSGNSAIAIGSRWWERSASPDINSTESFLSVSDDGSPAGKLDVATNAYCIYPAFCF